VCLSSWYFKLFSNTFSALPSDKSFSNRSSLARKFPTQSLFSLWNVLQQRLLVVNIYTSSILNQNHATAQPNLPSPETISINFISLLRHFTIHLTHPSCVSRNSLLVFTCEITFKTELKLRILSCKTLVSKPAPACNSIWDFHMNQNLHLLHHVTGHTFRNRP